MTLQYIIYIVVGVKVVYFVKLMSAAICLEKHAVQQKNEDFCYLCYPPRQLLMQQK
jgi:hypothetical protein